MHFKIKRVPLISLLYTVNNTAGLHHFSVTEVPKYEQELE
jgi:hypothetical protein